MSLPLCQRLLPSHLAVMERQCLDTAKGESNGL